MSKRPGKSKGHPPPGDFIALGAKTRPEGDHKTLTTPTGGPRKVPLPSVGGVKRETPPGTSSSTLIAKKPKLVSQTFTPLGRPAETERRGSPTVQIFQYEEIAKEVEPAQLYDAVTDAEERGRDEVIEHLLCGMVKYLKTNRAKPESAAFLTLMYLAKSKPAYFNTSENVIEAFCSLLKRDVSMNFKAKGNMLVSVLTCNLMLASFQDEKHWPDTFVKVYLEDSLGERVWVDRTDCKTFVDNIQTAFGTKMPRSSMLLSDNPREQSPASAGASPVRLPVDEEGSNDSLISLEKIGINLDDFDPNSILPRYTYQQVAIEMHVLDVLREHLTRRQPMDGGSRNLLRVMTAACGYTEVRIMAAHRLEMWLQNPKLTRAAQDLLMAVCMNCDQNSAQDVEVMSQLSKIRLKTKPLVSHYLLCMRELLVQHPENLRTLMTHTVYNELSNSRNPNNMSLLSAMFSQSTDHAANILAEIFQDLLCNRDDYLRALRALMREIVRAVRQDMNFAEFARGLMKPRTDVKFKEMDPTLKERLLQSLTDLVTLTALISVTSAVREAASALARGDHRDLEHLHQFQTQVSVIQRDSVWWLHTIVPDMFEVKPHEYACCLRKVLFVEKADQYYKIDNWPTEGDRGMMLRLVSEVPAQEDTLLRVLIIGLQRELGVNPPDALDLADQLVRRAAMLHATGFEVLKVERLKLFDAVFNLCTYRHPENIALPQGYNPPNLAISSLYWKAWIMMLVIAAFNPSTLGFAAWENYPTLKCFMEMVMTNNFRFPPPTMATDEKQVEEIRARDKQITELEKQEVLEFESHLAAATSKVTITEATSLLISQLTAMDPSGVARKPPSGVLEQLRSLNQSLQLGVKLCRSRNPDFLLDIIQRQGASQSMAWLADLVESSEGSLDMLPVQCLCEFLLHDSPPEVSTYLDEDDKEKYKRKQKIQKQEQLLARLQSLIHSPDADTSAICEVLNYFLKRLSSQQQTQRQLAVKGLSMVLSKSHIQEEEAMDTEESAASSVLHGHVWLLDQLPALPQFNAVRQQACVIVRQACQVETDAEAVSAYIVFLSDNMVNLPLHDMDELLLDMAQLIVERPTLINHLLPQEGKTSARCDIVLNSIINLFLSYLRKAQQPQEGGYMWSNTQDQIMLQWESGVTANMNILVVHAMIILLTFGKPSIENSFEELLDMWFPPNGHPPTAFLVDTSEEALLLPDWLKLRMIRSTVHRLVDAALQDLEPGQLVLFVQSFGIPVSSMSRLLVCLDRAVERDNSAMEQAVVDKGHMAQLIEVQHMRGATGGNRFHSLLKAGTQLEDSIEKSQNVEMLSPARRGRTTSHIQRAPDLLQTGVDASRIIDLLTKMFGADSPHTVSDRQQMQRSLVKGLCKEPKLCEVTIKAVKKCMTGPGGRGFMEGMLAHPAISCSLLRILISKQNKGSLNSTLTSILRELQKLLGGATNPLGVMVRTYLSKHSEEPGMAVQQQLHVITSASSTPEDTFVKVVNGGGEENYRESLVNACMSESLQGEGRGDRVATVCQLMTHNKQRLQSSTSGLLVDWLSLLDPDMISACPDLQQQLLFAKPSHQMEPGDGGGLSSSGSRWSQPYLLALLTHQGSWSSLINCVGLLLNREGSLRGFSATAALDFLWACIHIPKIWQGRDRKLPKNHEPEDVLQLTGDQIKTVVDYIIQEASQDAASSHQVSPHAVDVVDRRMALLLLCCCSVGHLYRVTVDHLHSKLKDNRDDWGICHHFLLQLYLQVPHVLGLATGGSTDILDQPATQGFSQLDLLSHRLLSALGETGNSTVAESRMYDANIACRKLATEHPVLLLRQLPLLAAQLQGRAAFSYGEMKHKNHLLLYTHMLGILELLQPYLFNKQHTALEDILAAYFELVQNHGLDNRQLASIVIKYIQLVHNFMLYDAVRASRMLYKYRDILNTLSTHNYPDLPALKSLLAGLALPQQEDKLPEDGTEENSSLTPEGAAMLSPVRSSSPWTTAQLAPFHRRIDKNAPMDDVLDVLRDLDETSKRKVDILDYFVDDLRRLMKMADGMARNTAHVLIMRYIRQNPSCAGDFVSIYVQCLESPNQDVINSTLKNLPEFTLLAQEHAQTLLQKAFSVGLTSKVETSSYLCDSIQLLNLESMAQ